MSISEEERMSVSEINENAESDIDDQLEEDEEAEDQLDEDLGDFSARRRSQLFIHKRLPQSKSDGHLLANAVPPQKRPRTPCFDESLNDIPMGFIRHSATYSGQFPTPNLKMSSGRSFIERLKERQRSKDEAKRRHSTKEVELPADLVESFDIDYQHKHEEDQLENLDGTWLNNDSSTTSPPIQTISEDEEPNESNGPESLIKTLIDKPPLPPKVCTSESVFNRLGLQNDLPERPDSLPNHWKLSQSEKLMATPTINKVAATPMETPYEYQADLCDLTTGSNESDEQQMAGRSAYLYYATAHVDDTDPENIPMADDDSLPPCSLTEIVQQSRHRVKPALRRRSPPIASEDELTDSEISELERQLANRHSSDDLNKQDSQETDGMPSQACQSPDVQMYYCRQPRQFLPGSASMPSFAINCAKPPRPLQVERAENGRSQLEETAQWLRKSKTQNFNQPGEEASGEQNLVQNTFLSGSRRRILPMRPDEIANQGPQKPVVHPVQPQQRRLPTLPQSPTEQFAYSGMSAKMASPTSNGYVKSQQQPARNEQIVHPLLSKHTQPPPQGSLPPKGTIASQLGHTHDYQLSYGIESSLVRSTTNYGLEDSYYEDGLNGNATHFPHRRTHNSYANQEDSSGISSLVSSDPYKQWKWTDASCSIHIYSST
ncbi:JNK-interacting protein 1 [Aphelenchoides bicaudatus]|nr:JNK-interacting protein 1 [Aphelenchoides bicaudatus]